MDVAANNQSSSPVHRGEECKFRMLWELPATEMLPPHSSHTFPTLPSDWSSGHMATEQVDLADRSDGKQKQQMKMTL